MGEVKNDKKKCFIITPIGSDSDPIRRHIDGILDTVIEPSIDEKGYELVVAHRITTPGSINKQVISGIYNADIVIANLTNLNPNVMYELAFSHSIGKPTITIAESGTTKLPFDITTERTIFYKNDFMGVIELKNQLESVIDSIEKNPSLDEIDNPIYTWLDKTVYENKLVKTIENKNISDVVDDSNLFKYIIDKLDKLESYIEPKYDINNDKRNYPRDARVLLPQSINLFSEDQMNMFYEKFSRKLGIFNHKLIGIYKQEDEIYANIELGSVFDKHRIRILAIATMNEVSNETESITV